MGLIFGTTFSIMDIEDVTDSFLINNLFHEINICLPIGIILGILSGALIYILQDKNKEKYQFKPLKNKDDNDI